MLLLFLRLQSDGKLEMVIASTLPIPFIQNKIVDEYAATSAVVTVHYKTET